MDRVAQPEDGSEREILVGWLGFHRDALRDNCAGLDAEQLVQCAVPASALSLLGIVRHMTEMERVYGAWPLGPKTEYARHNGHADLIRETIDGRTGE